MKKLTALLLVVCLCAGLLAGCGSSSAEPARLTFAESTSIDTIRSLNGQQVVITGYMATLSPLSGEYIYLMNLPYQSCPFCVPNTQQLSNTMAVYAAKGSKFTFTDRPIRVTGTMKLDDTTDEYGYQYNYRIVNARYEVVDLKDVSEEYALYASLAEDGVTADINAMFDYLMFVCDWPDYYVHYTDDAGNYVSYYLYPGDVENMLAAEAPDGYAFQQRDDYFPSLIRRVEAVDAQRLSDLTQVLVDASILRAYALQQLSEGAYTYDQAADKYTLLQAEDLQKQFNAIYQRFIDWLNKYEL